LLRYGFIKDPKYTVWKCHDEKDPSVIDAPGGTSSSMNYGGQASHVYITMSDLLQDMGDDDGGGAGDPVDTLLPEDAELIEEVC
jgi:hypothetical protein